MKQGQNGRKPPRSAENRRHRRTYGCSATGVSVGRFRRRARSLRCTGAKLGFIALTDAAPLIVAKELGLVRQTRPART
jgi:hypothetical protein